MEFIELTERGSYIEVDELLCKIEIVGLIPTSSKYIRNLARFAELAKSSGIEQIKVPDSLVSYGINGKFLAITDFLTISEIVEIISLVGIKEFDGALAKNIVNHISEFVTQTTVEKFTYLMQVGNKTYFATEDTYLQDAFMYLLGLACKGVTIESYEGGLKLQFCAYCLKVNYFDGVAPNLYGKVKLEYEALSCINCAVDYEFNNVSNCPKCNFDTLIINVDDHEPSFYCLNLNHDKFYTLAELESLGYQFDGEYLKIA